MKILSLCIFFIFFNQLSLANPCQKPKLSHFEDKKGLTLLNVTNEDIKNKMLLPPEYFNCDRDGKLNSEGGQLCLQAFFCPDPVSFTCTATRMQGGVFVLSKQNAAVLDFKSVDVNYETREKGSITDNFDHVLNNKICKNKSYGFTGKSHSEEGNRFSCLCKRGNRCGKKKIISDLYFSDQAPRVKDNYFHNMKKILAESEYASCQGNSCPISYAQSKDSADFYFRINKNQKTRMLNFLNHDFTANEINKTVFIQDNSAIAKIRRKLFKEPPLLKQQVGTGEYTFSYGNYGAMSSAEAAANSGSTKEEVQLLTKTMDTVAQLVSEVRKDLKCFPTEKNPAQLIYDDSDKKVSPSKSKNRAIN